MWIFFFLFWTAVRANEEPLYKKIGDKVVLTPDSVENPIYNILWMYGNSVAMEWYRFRGEPSFFRRFKDRGSLDISTGEMTITGLTPDDSGIYTPEINNRVNSKTKLLVISPVRKPNVSVSCEMTYCVFTCSGNITGAEPVTYWWTAGEKKWPSTKELRITKEDKEEWFSCELKNPVSSNSSEKVFNPFIETDNTWKLIYLIVPISLAGLIIAVYIRHKYRKSLKPQWQFGEWRNFRKTTNNKCSVTSDDIERWYQKTPHNQMPFTVKGVSYELDFDEMIQTDQTNGNVRMVRCEMEPPECKAVFCSHPKATLAKLGRQLTSEGGKKGPGGD